MAYLEYAENGQQYASAPVHPSRAASTSAGAVAGTSGAERSAASSGIKAIDPETGKTEWDFQTNQGSLSNGVLATAGGVLFAATRRAPRRARREDRQISVAVPNGGGMAASPMSYAVDGKQFVAVAAGGAVYGFALPE